jgi:hypothetical protein
VHTHNQRTCHHWQALIIQAAKHGLKLLAELSRVRGHRKSFESALV